MLLKLTQCHGFLYMFQTVPGKQNERALRTRHFTEGVLALRGIDNDQIWSVHALLLSVKSSMPTLKAVNGFCLEASPRTRGADSVLYQVFAIQNMRSLAIVKIYTDVGQAPMSRSRRRGGDNLRSSDMDCQVSGEFTLRGV